MRTGPFSRASVIDKLNAAFVPVYAVNEDYRDPAVTPKPERDEYTRIYREALVKKFSAGSVHVYVLAPSGEVVGTRHVADAAKPGELERFLAEMTAKLGTTPGKPLVEPRPQSRPKGHAPGSLVLHLVARGLGGGGSWGGTAEDWIAYSPDELAKLLPEAKPGSSREWDEPLARRLLTHVYPVTENNNPAKNKFHEQSVRVTTLSVADGKARGRIDARVVMQHDFYHKPDGKVVDATLLGYVDWDVATGRVTGFKLVTDRATYGGGRFAVAVRNE